MKFSLKTKSFVFFMIVMILIVPVFSLAGTSKKIHSRQNISVVTPAKQAPIFTCGDGWEKGGKIPLDKDDIIKTKGHVDGKNYLVDGEWFDDDKKTVMTGYNPSPEVVFDLDEAYHIYHVKMRYESGFAISFHPLVVKGRLAGSREWVELCRNGDMSWPERHTDSIKTCHDKVDRIKLLVPTSEEDDYTPVWNIWEIEFYEAISPMSISIDRPDNFLYLNDRAILPTGEPIIIGSIRVKCSVTDNDGSSVDKVEFYVNNRLQGTVREHNGNQYTWPWVQPGFGPCTLTVKAWDGEGNQVDTSIQVCKYL